MKNRRLRASAILFSGLAVMGIAIVVQAGTEHSGAQQNEKLAEQYASPGPFPVGSLLEQWRDDARDREVPVKIYFPQPSQAAKASDNGGRTKGKTRFPVIVHSHGLGGSRHGYAYLGRHWASHGYVVVHLQHKGSDEDVWKNKRTTAERMKAMREAVRVLENAANRPRDVRFALDELAKLNARHDGPLAGRMDLTRVGASGHSFGAYTVLAVIGQKFLGLFGRGISLRDPRIKAAVVMSPTVPARKRRLDEVFGSITIPTFYMTGTDDDSPIGETTAADRPLPFQHSKGKDQYLLVFSGGDHMIFSGRPRTWSGGQRDAHFQRLIRMSTIAFWNAYLKDDRAAKQWLAGGGFQAVLAPGDTFQKR